jgi:hypothetical protein
MKSTYGVAVVLSEPSWRKWWPRSRTSLLTLQWLMPYWPPPMPQRCRRGVCGLTQVDRRQPATNERPVQPQRRVGGRSRPTLRSDPLVQGAGLLMLAQLGQVDGEVVGRVQGVGGVLTQDAAPAAQGVLAQAATNWLAGTFSVGVAPAPHVTQAYSCAGRTRSADTESLGGSSVAAAGRAAPGTLGADQARGGWK